MNPTAMTATTMVLKPCMMPGPSTMRTAFMSLVARDMRSPVWRAWKNDAGWRSRWANRSLRRSYSTWRDMPISTWRMR